MGHNLIALDVQIISFRPAEEDLSGLLDSLVHEQSSSGIILNVHIWDNSPDTESQTAVDAIAAKQRDSLSIAVWRDGKNHGFGVGHNRLLAHARSDWVLLLNQDLRLDPGCLSELAMAVERDAAVAVWELRQRPYEHPKIYDPSYLDTPWFSGAAFMARRDALKVVGGFDPRIFMYGEDVDLAWRLRAAGYRVAYLPRASVIHHTYRYPHEVKPLQALEGTLTNLCLRARYGRWRDVWQGIAMLGVEFLMPSSFPGRRRGFCKVAVRFAWQLAYFRRSGRVMRASGFQPSFLMWNYALHRDGAFHPFSAPTPPDAGPLVSIVVRTHDRPDVLREALLSIANQTYRNIEVVVVEDGAPVAQAMIEREFASRMPIRYVATGEKSGRSKAGNLALSMARGDWLNFLDDDDQLFADHVEVLLETALRERKKGVYGLAWEVATRIESKSPFRYVECNHATVHRQPFSRLTMWHHNFLPIQTVLFHRSLYEKYGGFETDMDQLEDWNLWTRYTLCDDFLLVNKTTSKYRIPAESNIQADRQTLLDHAYQQAVARRAEMKLELTPQDVLRMVDGHHREQTVIYVSKLSLRRWAGRVPVVRWLYAAAACCVAWCPGFGPSRHKPVVCFQDASGRSNLKWAGCKSFCPVSISPLLGQWNRRKREKSSKSTVSPRLFRFNSLSLASGSIWAPKPAPSIRATGAFGRNLICPTPLPHV
jgi:GT2 family glycosyltransferase